MPSIVTIPAIVLLAGALVLLLLNKAATRWNQSRLALLLIGIAFLALLFLGRDLPIGVTIARWQPLFGSDLAYYVDGLAFLFAVLLLLVGLANIALGWGHPEDGEGSSYAALLILLAAGLSLVFSANLITLSLSWVVFDLAFLWALIGLRIERTVSRVLNLSCLACVSLLVAALLLGQSDDSLSLKSDLFSAPVFGLILLAALVRVGLYPLHLWIPIGIETGLPARSLLHLVPASAGLYLLARLSTWTNGGLPYGQALATVGGLAFTIGALLAWVEANPDTTLSFLMISQVGYVVASLAVVKPPAMVVWPSLNLVLCLGLLFANQARPKAVSGLAMASLAGVPLTLGFVGRWHVYHSFLTEGHLALLAVSLLAEILLFAALFKIWFASHSSSLELARARLAKAGLILLAAPILILGLYPPVLALVIKGVPSLSVTDLLRSTTMAQWAALFLSPLGGYLLHHRRQRIFVPIENRWFKLATALHLEWLYRLLGRMVGGAMDALQMVSKISEGRGYLSWIVVLCLLAFVFLRGRW
jgi:formate hydrogenlyase subunit 3/multisubunit Na+/H+ antiporter MnhD subunit